MTKSCLRRDFATTREIGETGSRIVVDIGDMAVAGAENSDDTSAACDGIKSDYILRMGV